MSDRHVTHWYTGDLHDDCGAKLYTEGRRLFCEKCGEVGEYPRPTETPT